MRPTSLKKDNTLYWVIRTHTAAGVLVDADSTPTVAVRKNGASTADVVTVTKRAATTGIYDCSYDPASEVEGDCFTIEETAVMSLVPYEQSFSVEVFAAERGTDSALLAADKPTNFDLLAINGSGEVTTSNPAAGGGSAHTAQDVANLILATPANLLATNVSGEVVASNMRGTDSANTVAPDNASIADILVDTADLQANQGNWLTATGFSTFDSTNDTVTTDTASRDASKADVSGLATQASVNAIDSTVTDIETKVDIVDANVDTILIDTAEIATLNTKINTIDGNVDAILIDTNEIATLETKINTIDGNVDAIIIDTAEIATLDGKITIIDGIVDDILIDTAQIATLNTKIDNIDGIVDDILVDTAQIATLNTKIDTIDGIVDDILIDTNEIADIKTKVDDIDANVVNILADTNELQGNQGDWATADVSGLLTSSAYTASLPTNFSDLAIEVTTGKVTTANPASGSGSAHTAADVVTAMQAVAGDFKADVSGLSTQASVDVIDGIVDDILVDTSELQGNQGDWATATGFNTVAPDNASIAAILVDTNDLQTNQGNWLTATGFATASDVIIAISGLNDFDPASDVVARVTLVDTTTDLTNGGSGGGDATAANQTTIINAISSLNDFDPAVDTVITDTASRNASKADVSGLSTFDASTDQVVASNMRGTDSALLASAAPARWSDLIIGSGVDLGKVTTSNPASGGGSNHTAQDVANLILITPANKLATDGSGNVEANNMRGTDDANTIAPVDVSANVAAILADTNELQGNQGDWVTATGFATPANITDSQGVITTAISGLNDFDPSADVVARVTLVDTTTDLTNQNSGGTNPADIYTYFTAANREAAFQADLTSVSSQITGVDTKVTNLNDFNPATTSVTTDNASRDASKADISTLATIAQINALDVKVTANGVNIDNTIKKNQNYRYTNYGTGTGFDLVTITEA